MPELDLMTSVPFFPIASVMMTAMISVFALLLATTVHPPRRSGEVDAIELALAAGTILLFGFLMIVLIYLAAPQLRHLGHSGF